MAKIVALLLLVLVSGLMEARHIHHRSIMPEGEYGDYGKRSEPLTEIDGMPIEIIRQIKPNRFVPVNNELFFKTYSPCEDGFKRDYLGNCREVWD